MFNDKFEPETNFLKTSYFTVRKLRRQASALNAKDSSKNNLLTTHVHVIEELLLRSNKQKYILVSANGPQAHPPPKKNSTHYCKKWQGISWYDIERILLTQNTAKYQKMSIINVWKERIWICFNFSIKTIGFAIKRLAETRKFCLVPMRSPSEPTKYSK